MSSVKVSKRNTLKSLLWQSPWQISPPPFFFALETHIPDSLKDALHLANKSPTWEILCLWKAQLPNLYQLAQGTPPADMEWGKLIPAELRPSASKNRLSPLMSLLYQHNLGRSACLSQFIFGFELTGVLSRQHDVPTSEKTMGKMPKRLQLMAKNNSTRFSERASESWCKNA